MIQFKIVLVLTCIFATTLSYAAESVGKLGLVRGQVTLNNRPTKSGVDIREGAIIEVKKGQATLLLGKGSVIHLASDSKMVVNQYGVSPAGQEGGELDLKFGRTRALILNQGNDKKDIKIKARAATMGVRGTEVFISAPSGNISAGFFFTLEGKAEVQMPGAGMSKVVNQNEGVVTHAVATTSNTGSGGNAGSDGAGSSGAPAAPGAAAPTADVKASSVSAEQVRSEVQNAGLAPPPIKSSQDMVAVASGQMPGPQTGAQLPPPNAINPGFNQFGVGGVLMPVYNPQADTVRQVSIVPSFESAGQ